MLLKDRSTVLISTITLFRAASVVATLGSADISGKTDGQDHAPCHLFYPNQEVKLIDEEEFMQHIHDENFTATRTITHVELISFDERNGYCYYRAGTTPQAGGEPEVYEYGTYLLREPYGDL
ncbi:hypothetical protein FRB94_014797, partial [Tulasnella sp. JGI-2019a]